MKIQEVVDFITNTNGKIFSLKFIPRTPPHEERSMVARTGVKKHLKGGEPAYSAKDHGLIVVFDMAKNGYRSIPIEGITEILFNSEWKVVEHDRSV